MNIAEAAATLARTPLVVTALLAGVPDPDAHRNDGPGTWSAADIVGHLLHADATNWLPRLALILEHGTGRSFEPFDREAMLTWARQPIAGTLDRFRTVRDGSLRALSALELTTADLDRTGSHPEFGTVRLGQVLAAWVAHDLTHTAQAAEVLAGRYRDEVGPYRKYLPALDRFAAAE